MIEFKLKFTSNTMKIGEDYLKILDKYGFEYELSEYKYNVYITNEPLVKFNMEDLIQFYKDIDEEVIITRYWKDNKLCLEIYNDYRE